jgi:xanthine/CO dehydrogenase XdhC/CoxF family maturation factor
MTSSGLLNAFSAWSRDEKPLVLASVYETAGSTYSKAGAQMLITGDGKFQGMLSGGCLEGDLAERARGVLESNCPQSVTYDLGKNDEELWGLGVGCDGLMKIFLQPLDCAADYEPFSSMMRALAGDCDQVAATVIESTIQRLPIGATMVTADGKLAFSDVADEHKAQIRVIAEATLLARQSDCHEIATAAGNATLLFSLLRPPPAILVLGAGLDAEPVLRFSNELGWRVTIQDHRPAYIEAGNFTDAEQLHCMPVDDLATTLDLERYAAAIVMSHHLASDRQYLSQLARTRIPYIGLLGPIDRRRRLLEELGGLSTTLEPRLHGPAGIDLGGRGPASIALSIVAEIHQQLMQPPTG